jgi:hypothetical protein
MKSPGRLSRIVAMTLLGALVLPGTGAAQSKYFGIIGGANLSDLSDETGFYSTDSRWGGNIGLVIGIRTSNRMILAAEPAWSQMGGSDGSVDYFELPILIGGMGRASQTTRFGGYTGIMPAFKLSCGIEQPASSCDNLKSSAWFLPLGVRFFKQAGADKFVGLDIRYALPLGSSFETVDVKQRAWSFRLVFVKGEL